MPGQTPSWRDLVAQAQLAEAVGFDALWIPDQLVLRTSARPVGWWEGGSLRAALAAWTSRMAIGSSVFTSSIEHDGTPVVSECEIIDPIRYLWHVPQGVQHPARHQAATAVTGGIRSECCLNRRLGTRC